METELARLPWFRQIDAATQHEFLASANVVSFSTDEIAQELAAPVTRVLFVVTGSFRVQLMDDLGRETFRGTVGRGGAIGLLSIATAERSRIRAEATEPCVALSLTYDQLLELGCKSKTFQRAMLELSASLFVRVTAADRRLPVPGVVAIVHLSDKTRQLTTMLANRLSGLGEQPGVLSDLPCEGLNPDVAFQSLIDNDQCIPPNQRRATIKSWASRGRLLMNLTAPNVGSELLEFLNYADKILWCIGEDELDNAVRWITQVERDATWVKDKLSVVWVLDANRVPPWSPTLATKIQRDFKLSLSRVNAHEGTQLRSGLERIVHYLRGVQIGLALGGGAARGMAHLGVLQALENEGIVVDRIAGTSAGAMTGTIYSLGLEPQFATQCFKNDLLPSWVFRRLPAGGYWYLLYKYRQGLFDPMLRKYLLDYRLEQLPIPMTTVSVDLVDAEARITSSGDATRAILESINLPPLSLPLIHEQQAIVDGGLLNNVPANVLVSQGCNFVIASTVTAKLERDFMEIRKRGYPKRTLFFNSIKVIMRQALVQSYSMNAVGVSPADFVVAPDVTGFDISEFTRADEMAAIGRETMGSEIMDLRKRLRLLDPAMF
jgi:predicted acylesterase/phospholipase RssA/CRP-like cAMP-binding protein